MTKWHFRKHEKYNKLATAVRNKGWKAHPLCIEVGCRGFTGHNWQHMAKTLNMKKGMSKRLKMQVAQVAQRCSYYLYLNRKKPRVVTSTSSWCTRLITTTPRNYIGCNNLNKKSKRDSDTSPGWMGNLGASVAYATNLSFQSTLFAIRYGPMCLH